MIAVRRLGRDSSLIAWRNLLNLRRTPGSVIAALVQPVMFVLLLAYVFGGSLGGAGYRTFLMGGIFAQAVTFNAAFTALGLAGDMDKGIVDRFRSLPMPAMAVLLGRTLSDLTMSAVTLAVTSLCGLLVGWRIAGSPADALLAYALILLFAFAMSWVGAAIGLLARSVEVAQSAGLIWLFPVTFVSSAFVSTQTMPGPLRTVAEWNPVSATATAVRQLFANPPPGGVPAGDAWPVVHALPYAVFCACLITGAFMLLALGRFRRITLG
ncbi:MULTISPECIES: ABC transporter permease [unclassified Streptomyces]|nr:MULTISPECIES: ABC transporter permease [unclassified Streptomyces]MYR68363.1 ABC transporter permease [Streptomyces sp. SID4939]MYS02699.1 ABC transporter permease [Streptomyces sp. SID4940]MYT66719.1 ABC transporter permease [Streptomyces sp. SID8357]MYT83640.1 ABC transporter permease [Streptomyces sp. SID8360]MYU34355.1 ABC transporter permease [Streptomyces sp. SID8358]MYW35629.1 ABC transporter permease [Streptomyces sp. SID1]